MIPCFLLGSLVAYFLVTIIYRVHIHPLSKFPGPRLAALTGLYEIYFAAWGTGSFEDEIERMHEKYGPVVRITPDEVHVQDQFYNAQHADSWIKGTKAIHSGRHQSGYPSPSFQIRKRSMSRVRSILQVEVHQIIRKLVRKHQVSRGFSWRLPSFASIPSLSGGSVDTAEMGYLEDGHQMRSSIPNPMTRNQFALHSPNASDPGLWKADEVKTKTSGTGLDPSLPF